MMDEVRRGGHLIAIGTLLPEHGCDGEGRPCISRIVGLGRLVRDELNPDGTSDIVLHGTGRGRILSELPSAPFRLIRFELQSRPEDRHPAVDYRHRRRLLQGIAERSACPLRFDVTAQFDVGTLADRIASSLRLPSSRRIEMMQAFSIEGRIQTLLSLLEEPRHQQRLTELIPSLADFSLSLADGKDTSR